MLTPEMRLAPSDWPVLPTSAPPRVTKGTTRPDSFAYRELSPSRTYLLRSGSMTSFLSCVARLAGPADDRPCPGRRRGGNGLRRQCTVPVRRLARGEQPGQVRVRQPYPTGCGVYRRDDRAAGRVAGPNRRESHPTLSVWRSCCDRRQRYMRLLGSGTPHSSRIGRCTVVDPLPVNPSSLPAPSGYSHGTLAGNTLYLGGQTALDADMRIVPGGIVEQFRQAFGNVLTTLAEAGGRPENLVSVTIFLTDIPDYQAHGKEIGRVWRELAGPVYPAMAGLGKTALWQPEAPIEILGVAVIPGGRLRRTAARSRGTQPPRNRRCARGHPHPAPGR